MHHQGREYVRDGGIVQQQGASVGQEYAVAHNIACWFVLRESTHNHLHVGGCSSGFELYRPDYGEIDGCQCEDAQCHIKLHTEADQ